MSWLGFPGGSDDKEPACIAGDPGAIPGSERSPGEGNGKPHQYSCLENSMDRLAGVHGVTKSWTEMIVTQSCLTLCDPMNYTVCGILQARLLEWLAIPFSRGSSQPTDQTQVSRIAGRFFSIWATMPPSIHCSPYLGLFTYLHYLPSFQIHEFVMSKNCVKPFD